ncbi:MAG: hypothetical protein H6P98_284, partial [Candidatus Aminicenantes bacterium]|nr:hypothetical protein [Candidatus Aminicenantes bacterium]
DYVAGLWKDFEETEFTVQAAVERTALELYRKDKTLARFYLDAHSNALGLRAFADAQRLGDELRTRFYR